MSDGAYDRVAGEAASPATPALDAGVTLQSMGPLEGLRVIEFAGLGPAPHAAMVLSDLGADVIRVERRGALKPNRVLDLLNRGRPAVQVDLKRPEGVEALLRLTEHADALIEGFRPGVMERLGLGPETCHQRNPRLVYGRMTGWGQEGPRSRTAGHDINYLALSGVLHRCRRQDSAPMPPLNLLGDFGGGSMFLVAGVLAAVLSAQRTGRGQVVDAAIVDGVAALSTVLWSFRAMDEWDAGAPGENLLDTGAHFYNVYECSDGEYVAVGAYEQPFYMACLEGLDLAHEPLPDQLDRASWPQMKQRFAAAFKTRTRDEWTEVFAGTDACVTPVLSPDEAVSDHHLRTRRTYVRAWGLLQPAPAPRFSRTPERIRQRPGIHVTHSALLAWGLNDVDLAGLDALGVEDPSAF